MKINKAKGIKLLFIAGALCLFPALAPRMPINSQPMDYSRNFDVRLASKTIQMPVDMPISEMVGPQAAIKPIRPLLGHEAQAEIDE